MATRRLREFFAEAADVLREAVDDEVDGPAPISPVDLESLSQDATDELPPRLREGFLPLSLVGDGSDVPGWKLACEAVDQATTRFTGGRRSALAVTGTAGSGRQALLDRLEHLAMQHAQGDELLVSRTALKAISVSRTELPVLLSRELGLKDPAIDAAGLRAALLDGPRRVIVVERFHNLYLRTIGGFDVLRDALSLISATRERVMWVLDLDAFAWNYLEQLFQVRSYVDAVVEAPALDAGGLRSVFERRIQAIADATFQFYPLRGLNDEERARWREAGFYERLHLASGGNPGAAGHLFTRSLRWSERLSTAFVIPPVLHPYQRVLATFPQIALLALALILEHESLSHGQLAGLLLLSPGEAQALLDGFSRYNVVCQTLGRYEVNPPWLPAIREHLADWNVL